MFTVTTGRTRRAVLKAGAIGLGGLTLPGLLRLQTQAKAADSRSKADRSVIVVWVHGGPSHLETYDIKPDAPTDCRSLYRPIPTAAPGVEVCEFLPRHAAIADKFTLVRSIAHDEPDHGFGTRRFCTGYGASVAGNGPAKYPAYECVVNHGLGVLQGGMPVSVNLGGFAASTPWRGAGYLGGKFEVPENQLSNSQLHVPVNRMADRKGLLAEFDRARSDLDDGDVLGTADEFRRRAFEVLTRGRAASAFDLSKEDPKVLARYRGLEFERGLLARRLVEAGSRLVNVYFDGHRSADSNKPGGKAHNWDDHAVNWSMDLAMRLRLPWYDECIATLIEDLHERGLDENTLLVVTGEFGRTPRLEYKDGAVGRDHWPGAMSVLVAGGGRRRGDVIGGTDKIGAAPVGLRHDPFDFLATIYDWLGIDYTQNLLDLTGRPVPLSPGKPIAGLV
jgi:uncharacterized protein (DUF1501 family)